MNMTENDKVHDRYAHYQRLRIDWPHERVIRVTMANGKMNSADAAMHAELGRIWRDIDADPAVSAVIFTGAGEGTARLRSVS